MDALHIVVAGAGGNTGSHLLPHLARMSNVARLTLVDPDVYESENLAVQNIEGLDIGRPKVMAQADKLRRIRPGLEVEPLQERVENVPCGLLACDLMVSCLDSRAARQHVNEIAWRLNTPWIDCGILGSQNLARVNAYVPSLDAPCLECSWGSEEYALLEQAYLCGAGGGAGDISAAYPSMASSGLGALASALMAIEITKLLSGDLSESIASRQVVLDAQHHMVQTTAGRRNPQCRFDHRAWLIEPRDCHLDSLSIAEALEALGSLSVEGHAFVSELVCPECGLQELSLRLNRPHARCCACDRRMVSYGFNSLEKLNLESAGEYLDLTLAQIGLRHGDIVTAGDRRYQLVEAE